MMLPNNQSLSNGSSEISNNSSDSGSYEVAKAAIFTALGLLSLMITCINCFVLYLMSSKRSLRTPTNACLASLSCSDLLAGLGAIPLVMGCTVQTSAYNAVCLSMELFNKFQSISTVLHLLVISLERYITIVHPLKIDGVVRMTHIIKILGLLWAFSLTLTLIQLSWVDLLFTGWHPNLNTEIIYDICLCVWVLISLLVMLFFYSSIFYTLRRHTRHIRRHTPRSELTQTARKRRAKEFRGILILSSMVITFILGWCGSFLFSLQTDLSMRIEIPLWLDYIFLFARYLTALINPLLYTFLKLDFNEAAMSILHNCKSKIFHHRDGRSYRATSIQEHKNSEIHQ